jgi:hypothetical protein
MLLNAYIGDLEDHNFKWTGGDWNGNVPRQLSPTLVGCFWAIVRAIEAGRYPGKQTDFGGWVAKVTRQQLLEFVQENLEPLRHEADSGQPPPEGYQGAHFERLQRVYAFLSTLEDGKLYALVAAET